MIPSFLAGRKISIWIQDVNRDLIPDAQGVPKVSYEPEGEA